MGGYIQSHAIVSEKVLLAKSADPEDFVSIIGRLLTACNTTTSTYFRSGTELGDSWEVDSKMIDPCFKRVTATESTV